MKKKLSIRAAISLLLSMILFCMPVGAFLANSGNAVDIQAQEEQEKSSEEKKENNTEVTIKENESEADNNTSEIEDSKPECICKELCSQYSTDTECEVCREDYTYCKYVNPSVKITITTPEEWYKDTAKVSVSVEDVALSGNFTIQSIQAKIGQNGSWTDITEDMYVEISENSTVYVLVTDQKGKTYERNRFIQCFDFDKPTLNAAVSDGLLSIQAQDTDSGIKAIYVNGYEFQKITNGVLNIRLQQFDAGYQYFTIQAMDNAGNMSEVYKTANPYYTDPETGDSNESDPAEQLPVDAEATNPSNATAQVTEHTKTDSEGNQIINDGSDKETKDSATKTDKDKGKEFYTIQTKNEKVFYLIIDRDGDEENVYFLTEISENDLLNTTTDNRETLPKNSAALESAIPVTGSALSNNNIENSQTDKADGTTEEGAGEDTQGKETAEEKAPKKENPMGTYLMIGIAAIVVIGAYYFKVVRKKKEDFLEEDEEDDEEEYEEEEENEDEGDDFFEDTEESEEQEY